jgi:hypothetical protein
LGDDKSAPPILPTEPSAAIHKRDHEFHFWKGVVCEDGLEVRLFFSTANRCFSSQTVQAVVVKYRLKLTQFGE